MNQSKLTPKEQATLFELAKKTGALPTTNMGETSDPNAVDPQAVQGITPEIQAKLDAGEKLTPEEAMPVIAAQMQQAQQPKKPGMLASLAKGAGEFVGNLSGVLPMMRGASQFNQSDPSLYKAWMAKVGPKLDPEVKEGLDARYANGKKRFREKELAVVGPQFTPKERAGAFFLKGLDPATNQPVYTDISKPGYFDREGNPVQISGRLIPVQGQDLPAGTATNLGSIEAENASFKYAAEKFKPEFVGPITGSLQQLITKYTDSDPERAEFYTVINNALIERLKRVSGGAVTPQEADRFASAFFNTNKSPTAFKAALNYYMNSNDQVFYSQAKNLMKAGYVGVPTPPTSNPSFGTNRVPDKTSTNQAPAKLDPGARYNQLIKSGLSKKQAYSLMAEEGY